MPRWDREGGNFSTCGWNAREPSSPPLASKWLLGNLVQKGRGQNESPPVMTLTEGELLPWEWRIWPWTFLRPRKVSDARCYAEQMEPSTAASGMVLSRRLTFRLEVRWQQGTWPLSLPRWMASCWALHTLLQTSPNWRWIQPALTLSSLSTLDHSF